MAHNPNPTLIEYALYLMRELDAHWGPIDRSALRGAIAQLEDAVDAGEAPYVPCPVCDDTGWTEVDSSHWGEHRSRRVSCECREGVQ
jgi:hypothetical protein